MTTPSRPFPARYRGRCTECPDLIELGQQIVMADDGPAHAACAAGAPARPERPVCPACWTVHAGECM